jgi:outer membrane protein assembly factor BamB
MRIGSTLAAILLRCGLCACFASARTAVGEDWTQFRGPTGQGHSAATGLPTHWSNLENVVWKHEIPGKGWSSPILVDRRLFLTTAVPLEASDSGRQSLRALCVDADRGNIVWNVEVFHQPEGVIVHAKNGHASPTPITDGQRLFVHFGTNGTACLTLADGKILWRNQQLKYAPVHGSGGSPVLAEDLLIVSCDGRDEQFVAAIDKVSGTIRWRTPRNMNPANGFSFGTPLIITIKDRQQVVSQGSDAVVAYDPGTGHEIWKVEYPGGYSVVPRPVFGLNMLFVCTGYDSPTLLAIRPEGASGDVSATHVVWRLKKAVPLNPSPLLVDDALYLISDNGLATCLEATTGKQRWQQRIGGNFSASPVYADGKIYLQSEEGDGIVLKPGSEYHELARNPLRERTLASYAVGDGTLYIRTEKHLARLQNK